MTTPAASPIADAIVTVLSAGSVLGPNAVSKDDYNVLISASIAAIVDWTNLNGTEIAFGGDMRYQWNMRVSLFIRDTGDAARVKYSIWETGDKMIKAFHDNQTLLGTVKKIASVSMDRTPGMAFTLPNGDTWMPIDINVSVVEWDN